MEFDLIAQFLQTAHEPQSTPRHAHRFCAVPLPIGGQDNETSDEQLLVDVESTTAFIAA